MDSTEALGETEPKAATGRRLPALPTGVSRDIAGPDLRHIYPGAQIHGDFWARPPTGPRVPAPTLETITVDIPPPADIEPAAEFEPVGVEDALYNIAAVPFGRSVETDRPGGLTDGVVAAREVATIELEGPAQAWVEDPDRVALRNDGAGRRIIEPSVVADTAEDPTDYYSAALRLTEPRCGARTVHSPTQAPVEDQAGCAPLPATQSNTDVLEGPAHDWLHDDATTPLGNGAVVAGDLGSAALGPVMLPQPAAPVVDLERDGGLVVAEGETRPPPWTLAAAIEPGPGPRSAATDPPAKATVVRHRPWKHPR
jgi:hypothetical protein